MKFRKLLLTILTVILLLPAGAFAHDSSVPHEELQENSGGLIDDLNANLRKQEELRRKIAANQSQQKTLAADIANLESQIELTRLEIEETQTRLNQLAVDIDDVSKKLEDTKNELEVTDQIATLRLRSIYKQSFIGPIEGFLGSDSFNSFLTRQKYTEAIRAQDLEMLQHLDELKTSYSSTKITLEDKKAKEEELKTSLESKKKNLLSQESSKEHLLAVTKNNEKEYQKLLSQVQSEIASIARALGGGGVRLGPVRRGDFIAFQGNTGCSTGSHLHFGLYIGGSARDPMPYLNSGTLAWPEENPRITQYFGANYWWYMTYFGMPGHNGIDMTRYDGYPIRAAADGIAYLQTDSSRCWMTGTIGKGIVINHYNGWKTIYWHIK